MKGKQRKQPVYRLATDIDGLVRYASITDFTKDRFLIMWHSKKSKAVIYPTLEAAKSVIEDYGLDDDVRVECGVRYA